MLNPGAIDYELSDRNRGILYGGMGAVQLLVKRLELDEAINQRLHLFKLHNPYFESDHVLNIAYNILCNGECLEDIERLRNDEVYLDAVGADRIPDPTTAGDFCRRFSAEQVEALQDAVNDIRIKVWKQQDPEFLPKRSSMRTARLPQRRANAKKAWTCPTMGFGAITLWWFPYPILANPYIFPIVAAIAPAAKMLFTILTRPLNYVGQQDSKKYVFAATPISVRRNI
jgi:hypothetical protein